MSVDEPRGLQGAALKAAEGPSAQVVSALRNPIHYSVNYVFEGPGPKDQWGEGGFSVPIAGERNLHQGLTLMTLPLKATLGH